MKRKKQFVQKRICKCYHSHTVEEDEDYRTTFLMNTFQPTTYADDYFLRWDIFAEEDSQDFQDWETLYFPSFFKSLRKETEPYLKSYLIKDLVQLILLYCLPKTWDRYEEDDFELEKTLNNLFFKYGHR